MGNGCSKYDKKWAANCPGSFIVNDCGQVDLGARCRESGRRDELF